MNIHDYEKAAEMIRAAKRVTAFTGAGISVESGIPPFRSKGGLWTRYDPALLDIQYFLQHPEESWELIKEIFYHFIGDAAPNTAHYALYEMEQHGLLDTVITQNIDNLHHEAGNSHIYEFHGNSRNLVCFNCRQKFRASATDLSRLPPLCKHCGGVLKPDFIFFGEPIPEPAHTQSFLEAEKSDVLIVIGTSGEVVPASLIPRHASDSGAQIIEVNTDKTAYTNSITDVFLQGKATRVMENLLETLDNY